MSTTFAPELAGRSTPVRGVFSRIIRAMQISRMQQALNMLSNEQLAEIGVKPSEIRDYAERLVDEG